MTAVAADNVAARRLYRRAGFEAVGRRPRYYGSAGATPVDALVMCRRLADIGVAGTDQASGRTAATPANSGQA
jgi:RimJ/RimL family protein N-acetyltransferase